MTDTKSEGSQRTQKALLTGWDTIGVQVSKVLISEGTSSFSISNFDFSVYANVLNHDEGL